MSSNKDLETAQMTIDHTALVRAMAVPYLAYEATAPYRILDENEAHEQVALKKREDIIGRPFLEVFPDTSKEFKKTGKSAPIESIKKIIKTKKPDFLGEFKWDIIDEDGKSIKKCWRSTQYPVFDKNGKNVVAVYQLTEDITHEVETETALAFTQQKLIEVLAAGQIGTWTLDIKNGVVIGGPNLSRMFGFDPDKAARGLPLGMFVEKIFEDDRQRVEAEINKAVASGKPYESEYRITVQNGDLRWVLARGQIQAESLEGANVFSGTLVDITDRKNTEQVLQESESRLRFMADSMPQLVWITRPDGHHEYYNQRWYEYTGTAAGTTDGAGWNDLFHPDDRVRARRLWAHSLKTGEQYEIEYRLYHAKTDTYRWVIGRALPLKSDDGEIVKWYGTCTDIDDQKRASQRQTFLADVSKSLSSLDTQKLLKKLTKLSVPTISDWCSVDLYSEERGFEQVSVSHVDPKKVGLAIEYRAHNPLHIDDDTAIPRMIKTGKPEFHRIITDELLEAFIQDEESLKFMKSLELSSIMIVPLKQHKKTVGAISFVASGSGQHFTDEDFLMANELASRVSLSLTNASLYDKSVQDVNRRRELEKELRLEKQKLEQRVRERTTQLQLTNQGLLDEINKRHLAEKELSIYSDELTRSNQELEDFAYVASHDLQEPLRKIQAFGNLLLTEYGDSLGIEGADYLQRMHSAASRMSVLIADLLAFSRVTRTQHLSQAVDLSKVIHEVSSDLESRIDDTKAELIVGSMPTVIADPTHMRQLFQNLIGNALKFHRPDEPPVVTVRSRSKKGGFEITVSDNGIGFDEKYLDRIFAVFQRLHERSTYEGTGIGLAVCRKIVERYNGTITATSTKNKGSTFVIWLPARKD